MKGLLAVLVANAALIAPVHAQTWAIYHRTADHNLGLLNKPTPTTYRVDMQSVVRRGDKVYANTQAYFYPDPGRRFPGEVIPVSANCHKALITIEIGTRPISWQRVGSEWWMPREVARGKRTDSFVFKDSKAYYDQMYNSLFSILCQ